MRAPLAFRSSARSRAGKRERRTSLRRLMERVRSATRSRRRASKELQLGELAFAGDELREVGSHPGLVGDDVSITGVGLGLSRVGVASPVHSQAGK